MMTSPLWHTANADKDIVEELANKMALPRRVASWLVARDIRSADEARRFLFAREQWTDPLDYIDIPVAVKRIKKAIEASELIAVVGDYDVDGVTASAILATELERLGANWTCMIPERVGDGYGLSEKLIERAKLAEAGLVITVDNGIRADDALVLANTCGLDVIVTDHHEPGDDALPDCCAIVHWSKHATPDKAKRLSGAGVAWKLTQALAQSFPHISSSQEHQDWLMGLAAIGAVSDMMPVRGENRRLIREGLAALEKIRRPGWLALCEQAGVDPAKIDATTIGWRIAPRLNAAGRIARAETAFQLFMCTTKVDAAQYAAEIEALNVERREQTEAATKEAVDQIQSLYGGANPSAIVVAGPWSLGVVGIVAARLVDKFHCPTLVLSDNHHADDVLRGSGRAPEGWSLYALMDACSEHLHHFGGHDAAVGCGVHRNQVEGLRLAFGRMAETAAAAMDRDDGEVVYADDYLSLSDVTLETLDYASSFSPFGPENEPFHFFIGPVELKRVTAMGNGKHLRLRVAEGKAEADVVWFRVPEGAEERLKRMDGPVALVVELSENEWQGKRQAQLRLESIWQLPGALTRTVFAQFYRHLHKNRVVSRESFDALVGEVGDESWTTAHRVTMVEVILDTFVELGFAAVQEGAYHVLETADTRDLREALHYQSHLRSRLAPCT